MLIRGGLPTTTVPGALAAITAAALIAGIWNRVNADAMSGSSLRGDHKYLIFQGRYML